MARKSAAETTMFRDDSHEHRLLQLAALAEMYYEQRLTQNTIARRMHISRSMISRYLEEAREIGVVEVRINHPIQRRMDLESALAERYSLNTVRVLAHNTQTYRQMLARLGALAATLLVEIVTDDMLIGVTGGGIHPIAARIAELSGCAAVDGFKTKVPFEQMLCVVIDCGGTARVGVYPMKKVKTIDIYATTPSGPLFRFITEEYFVSGVRAQECMAG